MNRLPNLLIAGTQKSGTTWTHFTLNKSQLIYGSNIKELNFFNHIDLNHNKIEEYKKNFPVGKEQYYMESTPHYFRVPNKNLDIASNIHELLPENDLKLIVIFRNPIERALSATVHHMMQGRLEYKETISKVTNFQGILDLGFYHKILQFWKPIFKDNLAVFFYDEIEKNPKAYINSIFSFLCLENDLTDDDLDFRVNDKKIKAEKMNKEFLPKCTMEVLKDLKNIYEDDINKLFNEMNVEYPEWFDLEKIYIKFNNIENT